MARVVGKGSSYLHQRRKALGLVMLAAFVVMESLLLSFRLFRPLPSTLALIGILLFLGLAAIAADVFRTAEKQFFKFFDGMYGEERVVKLLRSLPGQYSIFRNVKIQDNNDIDLIVVGPTGIYTIEVKSHVGRIGFDGECLTRNGHLFPEKDPISQVLSETMSLHQYILEKTGQKIFINPVIVFSSNHVSIRFGMKKQRGVFVIQRQWLINLITTEPQRPTTGHNSIVSILESLTTGQAPAR
jgi:hypothetical protein